ncbi:MAG: SpoIIE family protein phosphatase [Bacteroidota bacterium]
MLISWSMLGQPSSAQLWLQWHDYSLADSLRYQALENLIEQDAITRLALDSIKATGPFRFSEDEEAWQQALTYAYYVLGNRLNNIGNPREGLLSLQHSYEMARQFGDAELAADAWYQMGNSFYLLADYNQALAYYQSSLQYYDSLQNQERVGRIYLNIGNLYFLEEEYDYALDYYQRSRALKQSAGVLEGIGPNLNNLGMVQLRLANYKQAELSFQEAIATFGQEQDSAGIANTLVSLTELQVLQGEYEAALVTIDESLVISEKGNHQTELADGLHWKSRIYQQLGNLPLAQTYAWEALSLAQETGNRRMQQQDLELLYQLHKAAGDMATALSLHEEYVAVSDNLNLAGLERRLLQEELKQEAVTGQTTQKEAVALSEEKLRTSRLQLILQLVVLLIFLIGAVAFGIVNVRRLRLAEKQRATIADQKNTLDGAFEQMESKTQQISSSIEYAQRIQSTILPSAQYLAETIPDHFLLYLPKDVVAGDFYWLEKVGSKTLLAVADCTGHGVPGAIVSMVCSQALNRSVREFKLTDPAEILDMTREIILARFASVRGGVPDGMDISLCCLEGNTLTFAGANHSLYWVRPEGPSSQRLAETRPELKTLTGSGNCLFEIKGNKQPIGKHPTNIAYTAHTLELSPEDNIYLFSDGFADQLNAADGSTYKAKRLKKLLVEIAQEPMDQQRERLHQDIQEFRKDFIQVDDITVLGFRWQNQAISSPHT